jgi:hypothetical protein
MLIDPLCILSQFKHSYCIERTLNSFVCPISWWDRNLTAVMGPCQAPKPPVLGFSAAARHEWTFPVSIGIKLKDSKAAMNKYLLATEMRA